MQSPAGLALALTSLLLWAHTAQGFAVLSGFNGNTRSSLEETQRWNARPGSVGSLADGIQVAIEPDFFARLGNVDPAVEPLVRQRIVDSFRQWENGVLRFEIEFDGPVVEDPGQGAEIDVFFVPAGDPRLCGSIGGCAWWLDRFRSDRMLSNGEQVAGFAIEGVDIFLDADTFRVLFNLALESGGLEIFQRTLMHEIGHGIGLHHPNQLVSFDTDSDPNNPMPIDPDDVALGLMPSLFIDCTAIMINMVGICDPDAADDNTLHFDDRGGRDLLYPEPSAAADSDLDGRADTLDNCPDVANDQLDADADGFGNACDGDFNQDGLVGGPDFDTLLGCFNRVPAPGVGPAEDPDCAESDMNGDDFVGGPDFDLFLQGFNRPPGS